MAQAESEMKMRILFAAKKLFARQGFDGTSVRQICEEAGANVALISYYFGGKEKVYRALFECFFPGQRMSQYEDLLKSPVEGLKLLISEIISFSMNDKELSSIIQQEMVMVSPRTELIVSFTGPVWKKARELLEQGREQGLFHFDSLDQALMMVVGVTLAHKKQNCYSGLLTDGPPKREETAHSAVRFVLRALGADTAGTAPS